MMDALTPSHSRMGQPAPRDLDTQRSAREEQQVLLAQQLLLQQQTQHVYRQPPHIRSANGNEQLSHSAAKKWETDANIVPSARITNAQLDVKEALHLGAGWTQPESAKMLAVGQRVLCVLNAGGGSHEAAEVVAADLDTDRVYVHFTNCDRRLDRWVSIRDVIVSDGTVKIPNGMCDAQPKLLTRRRRRQLEEFNPVSEKEVGNEMVEKMEKDREERTKVKNIAKIVFGHYEIETWYFSPYPGPYGDNLDCLYVCGNCLKYVRTRKRYNQHCEHCDWNRPPGARIYHDAKRSVSVYEVDGMVNTAYCQRLCLLAKLFLDHKTLFFDVAPFLFYIITIGGEVAGFFSKERPLRRSEFNLACILTLPQHQRKGVGRFLISFSYELTRREGKIGSPERPLSDLGQVSYRSYWMHAILEFVTARRGQGGITAGDVAKETGIREQDVVDTLKSLNMLHLWKGERIVVTTNAVIDAAENRATPQSLPLRPELLDYAPDNALGNSSGEKNVTPKQNPAVTPMTNKRKRSKSTPCVPVDHRFSTPVTPRPVPLMASLPTTPRTPPSTTAAIYDFVQRHTAERVVAHVNTADGVPAREFTEFAESTGISVQQAMRKTRKVAVRLVQDPGYVPPGLQADPPPPKRPKINTFDFSSRIADASASGAPNGPTDSGTEDVLRTPPRAPRPLAEMGSPGWPTLEDIRGSNPVTPRPKDGERGGSSTKRQVGRPRGSSRSSKGTKTVKARETRRRSEGFNQDFFDDVGSVSAGRRRSAERGSVRFGRGVEQSPPRMVAIPAVTNRIRAQSGSVVASGRRAGSLSSSPIRRRMVPPVATEVINLVDTDEDDDLIEVPSSSKSRYLNGSTSTRKY